jgi:hypothetical protein
MMPIQLTLDPSLQISPSQFAAAWNADPRTDDFATAEVSTTAGADQEVEMDEVILLRTAQTAMPVGAAALYDLIQDILVQQGVTQQVQIAQDTAPDGGELLAVTLGSDQMSEA